VFTSPIWFSKFTGLRSGFVQLNDGRHSASVDWFDPGSHEEICDRHGWPEI